MPKLPTFTAKLGTAQTSAAQGGRRADAGDFFAGGLEDLGRAVGKVAEDQLARMEAEEQRRVLVAQAEIRAKYAKALDEAAISNADVEEIRLKMEDDLSRSRDGLETRKGRDAADYYDSQTQSIFQTKANAVQVSRATATARTQGQEFLGKTAGILNATPEYLPQAELDVDAFVATLDPKLSMAQRKQIAQDLKMNLHTVAARSNARVDPVGTIKAIEGGAYHMSAQDMQSVISFAHAVERQQKSEAEHQAALARQRKAEASNESRLTYTKAILSGSFDVQAALRDPNLDAADLQGLASFQSQRTRELRGLSEAGDPKTFMDLWQRANLPVGHPSRIVDSSEIMKHVGFGSGKISTRQGTELLANVRDLKDENNQKFSSLLGHQISNLETAIARNPELIAQPAKVAAIQSDYMSRVRARAELLRSSNEDPFKIFDPQSKHYTASAEFMNESFKNVAAAEKEADKRRIDALVEEASREADGQIKIFKGHRYKFTYAPGKKVNVPADWEDLGRVEAASGTEPTDILTEIEAGRGNTLQIEGP